MEHPSIGEYWNISGVPVLPKMGIIYIVLIESAGVIQKLTILKC